MAKTRHFHKRMGQRGITQCMIDMVCSFGIKRGETKSLDRNNIDELLQSLDKYRKKLINLRDKGGLVVIEVNDELIATYHVDSFNMRKSRG